MMLARMGEWAVCNTVATHSVTPPAATSTFETRVEGIMSEGSVWVFRESPLKYVRLEQARSMLYEHGTWLFLGRNTGRHSMWGELDLVTAKMEQSTSSQLDNVTELPVSHRTTWTWRIRPTPVECKRRGSWKQGWMGKDYPSYYHPILE